MQAMAHNACPLAHSSFHRPHISQSRCRADEMIPKRAAIVIVNVALPRWIYQTREVVNFKHNRVWLDRKCLKLPASPKKLLKRWQGWWTRRVVSSQAEVGCQLQLVFIGQQAIAALPRRYVTPEGGLRVVQPCCVSWFKDIGIGAFTELGIE